MPLLLLVVFIIVPLVELAVVLQVAQAIDLGPTLLLLLGVSLLGGWLLRREGVSAWRRFNSALAQGRPPTREVVDGALVLVGGTLLLTPGFVTDAVGLALVFPPTRAVVNRLVRARVRSSFRVVGMFGAPGRARTRRGPHEVGEAIDVEVVDIERERRSG